MKKAMLLFFFIHMALAAYSFDPSHNLSLGFTGVGISETSSRGYVFGNLVNFFYQTNSGFGFDFSPAFFSFDMDNVDNFMLSHINLTFFYNILRDENIFFGPFAAVNTLNFFYIDFYELRAGLNFRLRNIDITGDSLFSGGGILGSDLLVIEAGYKYYSDGKKGFYASVGFDLIGALYALAMGNQGDVDKYQREHPQY